MTDDISKVVPPVHAATFVPSFSEAARCLGMAQAQGKRHAIAHWQGIVDAHETAAKAALRDLDAVCDEAAALPAVPDGVNAEAIGRVTWHIGKAIEYIEKQYPNGRTLDRGPIMRNMRRWHAQLLAATPANDQPEGDR